MALEEGEADFFEFCLDVLEDCELGDVGELRGGFGCFRLGVGVL